MSLLPKSKRVPADHTVVERKEAAGTVTSLTRNLNARVDKTTCWGAVEHNVEIYLSFAVRSMNKVNKKVWWVAYTRSIYGQPVKQPLPPFLLRPPQKSIERQ